MISQILSSFAAGCSGSTILGFPTWYKYLSTTSSPDGCDVHINHINDVWAIAAAILEMLLRAAAIIAVAFIIIGAIQYIASQGEPENIAHAKNTIINAIVGLVLAILASVIVSFVAGIFI